MKLTALRLHNVRRFGARGVALEGMADGVNVLCAANEFGKSTCFDALHALFFQPHTGTPGAVQLLKPYSGGSPLIEADIETSQGRFRLGKRFYGGKFARVTDLPSGRVLHQADEAEQFIAALVGGGAGAPAGLLWVRQGITGIEKRSKGEQEDEKRVREDLLTSVQGEVEALTGGRRMAEIMAAIDAELALLATGTGRPKTGGAWSEAIAERDRLAAETDRLALEVEALHQALDDRRKVQAELKRLADPADRAARMAALAEAEAGFEAARIQAETLKRAEAEASLARARRDAAKAELDRFDGLLGQLAALAPRLAAAASRRDAEQARHGETLIRLDAATRDTEAAEREEAEHRALLHRLDRVMQARDAKARRTDLAARLAQAEAARTAAEAAAAAARRLALPPGKLDALARLEIELEGLRATQAATLPAFRLNLQPGGAGSVTLDGQPLADGTEQTVSGTVQLDIAGVGTIAIRAGRTASSGEALEKARLRHAALLRELGVDSLAAARERDEQARAATATMRSRQEQLTFLAPDGVAALQEALASLPAETDGDLELKADPAQARAQLDAAAQRLAETRAQLQHLRPACDAANQSLVAAQGEHATALAALRQITEAVGTNADRDRRHVSLQTTLATAQQVVDDADAGLAELRVKTADLDTARARLERARSALDNARQQEESLGLRLANLSGQVQTRTDDAVEETLAETRDLLAAATTRAGAFELEVKTMAKLRDTLAQSRSAARDLYLRPVMRELTPLLGLLFDDAEVEFDETTLLPHRVRRNGQDEDIERLSGGAREQLSVLTRLAFARLLAQNGRRAPVILDDALVYSDDDRIEKMFDALHRQSRDQQIIVFSCRQRAFGGLGGNVLTLTDWRPEDV